MQNRTIQGLFDSQGRQRLAAPARRGAVKPAEKGIQVDIVHTHSDVVRSLSGSVSWDWSTKAVNTHIRKTGD
jgi:hypothetical protein